MLLLVCLLSPDSRVVKYRYDLVFSHLTLVLFILCDWSAFYSIAWLWGLFNLCNWSAFCHLTLGLFILFDWSAFYSIAWL